LDNSVVDFEYVCEECVFGKVLEAANFPKRCNDCTTNANDTYTYMYFTKNGDNDLLSYNTSSAPYHQ